MPDLEFRKSLDGLQWSEDTQHSQRFNGLNVPSFIVPVLRQADSVNVTLRHL